jgi:hypothetical protein
MRKLAMLLFVAFLSGCIGAGPTPEQAAELKSISDSNHALIQTHKITNVEGANRYNAAIERITDGRLSETDHLMMSYRVALASQIDSGQLTPETAKYQWEQRVAENQAQDRAATAAALAQVGDSLQQASANMQAAAAANRTINCNSMANGNIINTTCY